MTILGLILMAAGFIGVLVCAKIQKTNPSIQPVAILCALVMLGGLGTYFWFYWNKGKYEAQAAAARQQIFNKALMDTIGKQDGVKGKKIYWLTNDTASDSHKACLEALKNASGSEVVLPSANGDEGMMMGIDAKTFKTEIAALTDNDVILLDSEVSNITQELDKAFNSKKGPRFVITDSAKNGMFNMKKISAGFKNGKILFAVSSKSNIDQEFEPDEDKLDEAFNNRYQIVKEYNEADWKM